jgi:transposase
MNQTSEGFSLPPLVRKKVEKLRRQEKDARIHKRLSALLWLNKGYAPDEVADLPGVCPRTVANWVALFQAGGVDLLCRLDYQGDPG